MYQIGSTHRDHWIAGKKLNNSKSQWKSSKRSLLLPINKRRSWMAVDALDSSWISYIDCWCLFDYRTMMFSQCSILNHWHASFYLHLQVDEDGREDRNQIRIVEVVDWIYQ